MVLSLGRQINARSAARIAKPNDVSILRGLNKCAQQS